MVKSRSYIPARGDLVWLNFHPQSGHEQSGKRPALTISPYLYNKKTSLALFCPVTSHSKGYPFEVPLGNQSKIFGVVLCDHIKNLDYRARDCQFIVKIPQNTLMEVILKIQALIVEKG